MQQPFKHLKVPEAEHKPSLPIQKTTPRPERSKVVSPVRVAVNKQTAMLLSPNRCWLSQPIPDRSKTVDSKALDAIKAELKIERNASALIRDELGVSRSKVRLLKTTIAQQSEEIQRLKRLCEEQAETIKQLEDLKL